jgi:hypothetical protein
MFGDFFNQFGLNQFLQSMKEAQQQPPFAAGAVDTQGGLFGPTAGAPTGLTMPGMAGGPERATGGFAPGGAAPGGAMPTPASAGSPRPASTALQPGGSSPLAPVQPGGQMPKGPIEQGAADQFMRAGESSLPGMGSQQPQRRFEDLMR